MQMLYRAISCSAVRNREVASETSLENTLIHITLLMVFLDVLSHNTNLIMIIFMLTLNTPKPSQLTLMETTLNLHLLKT
jgi:hypothetical protein